MAHHKGKWQTGADLWLNTFPVNRRVGFKLAPANSATAGWTLSSRNAVQGRTLNSLTSAVAADFNGALMGRQSLLQTQKAAGSGLIQCTRSLHCALNEPVIVHRIDMITVNQYSKVSCFLLLFEKHC